MSPATRPIERRQATQERQGVVAQTTKFGEQGFQTLPAIACHPYRQLLVERLQLRLVLPRDTPHPSAPDARAVADVSQYLRWRPIRLALAASVPLDGAQVPRVHVA